MSSIAKICVGLIASVRAVVIQRQDALAAAAPLKIPLKAVPVRDERHEDVQNGESFLQIDANQGPDYILVGNVAVGTPSQTFRVIFDSGSGNLVLPAKTCQSAACKMHHGFQPRISLTSDQTIDPDTESDQASGISLPFSSEEVHGITWHDRFCMGPKSGYCVNSTNFILAKEMPMVPFGALPADGVMGLALPTASVDTTYNVLFNMKEKGAIPKAQFAMWFPDKRVEKRHDGEITLGGLDESRFLGELQVIQVNTGSGSTGRWELDLKGIFTSNEEGEDLTDLTSSMSMFQKQATIASVVDTGTTIIGGSSEVIADILEILQLTEGKGHEGVFADNRVECGTVNSRKRLGLHLGEKIFFLKPWDYIKKIGPKCYHLFGSMHLTNFGADSPVLLLGYPFLKRFYTVFDQDVQTVGLALAKHELGHGEVAQEDEIEALIQQAPAKAEEDDGAAEEPSANLLEIAID